MESWQVAAVGAVATTLGILTRFRRGLRPPKRLVQPRPPYPGDFDGRVDLEYHPHLDGDPDPGEIVWTWVPFEEDHSMGKDRPVLLIGREGSWLLGLMLTSKDHDNDRNHADRWLDIGTGPWDPKRRPSEVRLDRIIRINPGAVRREGAVVPRATFEAVSRSLFRIHNW